MLKQHATVFRRLMIAIDAAIAAAAFYLAYLLREQTSEIYTFSAYLGLVPIYVGLWSGLLYSFQMYSSFRIKPAVETLHIIFKSIFFSFLIFSGLIFVLKIDFVTSDLLILMTVLTAGLIMIEKIIIIAFFRYIRTRGYNFRNILIVGTGTRAQQFIDQVKEHNEWGLKISGLVDEDKSKKGQLIDGFEVIGTFEDIPQIIEHQVIDDVVFVVPRSWLEKIEPIMLFCEEEGKRVHLAVDYFSLKLSRARPSDFSGLPLITFESTPQDLWKLQIKRLIDIIVSAAALLVLWPVFILVGLIIKATSVGPVYFLQERMGLNGRIFKLVKFRTMVQDAEKKVEGLRQFNEMQGPVFKMKDDPRLTGAGKFLRKFSIDELPQLWNVFVGDMSLIGPRPPLPKEVDKYDRWHRRRLSMKPGMTGLWQVSGRNYITDFNQWMKLDLEYIDTWSLSLDAKILLKTVPVVLFGIGAK